MSAAARYARILRTPHVAPLLGAVFLARLPLGILSLAIVLFLREETGSYATAGAVAAAFALGAGASSPVQGRLIDRHGQGRVLVPLVAMHVAGLAGVIALGFAGAPVIPIVVCAVLAGAGNPPMSSVLRTLWPGLLHEDPSLVPTAFALDGVIVELMFVVGPLLTAGVAALASPAVAIGLGASLVAGGTLAFCASEPSRAWRPPGGGAHHGILGALSSPGIQTLVITTLPFGFCFGGMEVALPAFSDHEGTRELAGLLLAVWSLASATGGLVYGARQPGSSLPLASLYTRVALLLPLGFAPVLLAPSIPVMALLVLPAGVCIAPLLASGTQLTATVAPAGTATEAYTWPITSLVVGIAAGNAAAGGLAQAIGWRAAIAACLGAAALGAALAYARRATLHPGPA